MKALKIIKCSNSMMWYAEHVGKIVPLIHLGAEEHLSREPAGYTNIVRVGDCEIIDVQSLEDISFARPYDGRYK